MSDRDDQYYKRWMTFISSSGVDGKTCVEFMLMRSTRVRIRFSANLFLPFQITSFIFNKNERNNQKVENKVTGKLKEGFIVPVRWHSFNNLN